jgi:hypothetical protein
VPVDLHSLAEDVRARSDLWLPLRIVWTFGPVHPNYDKALVGGSFHTPPWFGELHVWISGEAELMTLRTSDGWFVNKHYELATSDDLAVALDELAGIVGRASVPNDAVAGWEWSDNV